MRNKIFGGIGVVWGGLILFFWLTAAHVGSSAYQTGRSGAAVFVGLMLVVGLYYFFKKPKQA